MKRTAYHALAWVVAAISVLLLLLSLTAPPAGYSGMGVTMMWLWAVVPIAALVILGAEVAGQHQAR